MRVGMASSYALLHTGPVSGRVLCSYSKGAGAAKANARIG